MNQKICYVHELTDFEKQKANEIMNLGFNTDLLQDRLSYPHDTNLLISLVIVNDVIVGVALGKEKTENVMEPLSKQFIHIHSLAVHPDHRGKGYCFYIVDAFVKKYGQERSMYLNVNTSELNPNVKGIKCYQKNGFRLVDCLYEYLDGEPHSFMVRVKGKYKKPKKPKKPKRTKKKKRKFFSRNK